VRQAPLEVLDSASPSGGTATPAANGLDSDRAADTDGRQDRKPPDEDVPARRENAGALNEFHEWRRTEAEHSDSDEDDYSIEPDARRGGKHEHPLRRTQLSLQGVDRTPEFIVTEQFGRRVVGAVRRKMR
jgi:hypothetical protein